MRRSLAAALFLIIAPAGAQVRLAPSALALSGSAPVVVAPLSAPRAAPALLSAPSLAASPSLSAALSAPAALAAPAIAASSDAPEPARAAPAESARSLNVFWDGLRLGGLALEDEAPAAAPLAVDFDGRARESLDPSADRLVPWLATDDARIASALESAAALARRTRPGRRAFAAAEKALAASGKTLPVSVLKLGRNYGEYDFLEGTMRLHEKLFAPGAEAELAGTLTHELMHVAQHAQGLPSNALEMELEAHLSDLEMLEELGAKPPKHTFARQALEALAKGPKTFVELIDAAVPGLVYLGNSSFDEIEEQLEKDLRDQLKRAKRSPRAAALASAIERDLERLRTPEGRANYEAFSRRVRALLRRRAAAAAR